MPNTPWLDNSLAPNGLPVCVNFENWFRGSKAVTPKGLPLLLYHGTMADFDRFHGGEDGAMYFSPAPDVASWFALGNDRGWPDQIAPLVMPVFIAVRNPKILTHEELAALIGDDHSLDWTAMPSVIQEAKDAGHDGMHLVGLREENGGICDQWLAFKPSQIKSALCNTGLYSEQGNTVSDRDLAHALPSRQRVTDAENTSDAAAPLDCA